jgi:hypothetical protein
VLVFETTSTNTKISGILVEKVSNSYKIIFRDLGTTNANEFIRYSSSTELNKLLVIVENTTIGYLKIKDF